MPFTPTHVAAAIPIAWMCRWRVPLTALAIGSMVPDLPNFVPGLMSYHVTHSVPGILTHCMPIGLVLYYLFHGVFKHPLGALFPESVTERLRPALERKIDFSVSRVLIVAILVAVGASTHVFWDSFTHLGRWGVNTFPILRGVAIDWEKRPIRWYALLQHGSSIVLLPPMFFGFLFWVRRQPRITPVRPRYRVPPMTVLVILLTIIFSTLGYWRLVMLQHTEWLWIDALRVSVKRSGTCVLLIALIYSIWMHLVWWSEEHQPAERRQL
tara:strand:+ start:24970 stop:25773 length:804 start_codon:yes stop_codon:yes gene_type:complete